MAISNKYLQKIMSNAAENAEKLLRKAVWGGFSCRLALVRPTGLPRFVARCAFGVCLDWV